MSSNGQKTIKVGILTGAGTGVELVEIFKTVLSGIVQKDGKSTVEFIHDFHSNGNEYIYGSFQSIQAKVEAGTTTFAKQSQMDVNRLVRTVKRWHNDDIQIVFRTAINAEALYKFRQRVKAVKVFALETLTGTNLIFVRDQAEGFYATSKYELISKYDKLEFRTFFTKKHQKALVQLSLSLAHKLRPNLEFKKWAIYKFHLFGNIIGEWIHEADKDFDLYQPDTGLTNLNKEIAKDRDKGKNERKNSLLIICGNEVGDLIFETILGHINVSDEDKIDFFTRNYYMAAPFNSDFVEYQTVHGSADDKTGQNTVLPFAVLRIVADIAEKFFHIPDIKSEMEEAISIAKRKRLKNTSYIIEEVKNKLKI